MEAENEAHLNEMRTGTEEECRLSSLIVILDSSAGSTSSTARVEHRIKIAEQLLYTINKKEAYKREFLSSKGVEACLNVIEDLDNKQLALSCVKILISLLEFGFARRFIQNNGTATIFQLVSRCHSEDRAMQNHAEIVKNSLNLLILAKAKDKGFGVKCVNADGMTALMRLIREPTKVRPSALNLLKIVSGSPSCSRVIIPSLQMLFTLCQVAQGKKNTGHVRIILQLIHKAIKVQKKNITKSLPMLPVVVDLIESWHKYDHRHGCRLIHLRKGFIILLKSMTSDKEGRAKLSDQGILKKLCAVAEGMMQKNEPEQVVRLLISTMQRAIPSISPAIRSGNTDTHFEQTQQDVLEMPTSHVIEEQYRSLSYYERYFIEENSSKDFWEDDHSGQSLTRQLSLPKLSVLRRSTSLGSTLLPKKSSGSLQDLTQSATELLPTEKIAEYAESTTYKDLCNVIDHGWEHEPRSHSNQEKAEISRCERITKNIDRFSDMPTLDDINNVLPCCELFGQVPQPPSPMVRTKPMARHNRALQEIEKYVHPDRYEQKLVYAAREFEHDEDTTENLLVFDSKFESGNLAEVYWTRDQQYELWIEPDMYQDSHRQWFFFKVGNIDTNHRYQFSIMNFEKKESQFGKGMQPLMFSVDEARVGNPHWRRIGSNIMYFSNNIRNKGNKNYYTMSFDVTFPRDTTLVYMAYHFPYTYTRLKAHLNMIRPPENVIFQRQTLCQTLLNNKVDLVTITAAENYSKPISSREYIVISARVHPGETNSSWIMKGILDFLVSDHKVAEAARNEFIFKLVPMLNPDGCIIGNHRTNMAKFDLNRQWEMPNPNMSPSIYYLKGFIASLNAKGKTPMCYIDLHGHSLKKNAFIFGCDGTADVLALPRLLNRLPMFSLMNCRFQLSRETCARTVVYRRLGIPRSYTLESTYNGCNQGKHNGLQITENDLCQLGVGLVATIKLLKDYIAIGKGAFGGLGAPYQALTEQKQERGADSDNSVSEEESEASFEI